VLCWRYRVSGSAVQLHSVHVTGTPLQEVGVDKLASFLVSTRAVCCLSVDYVA
jgi:hypothetical protein